MDKVKEGIEQDILEPIKAKPDTIITSNQYIRQGEFDKVVNFFMSKTNIDAQCMADLMLTWILANGTWGGKASMMASSTEQIKTIPAKR